MRLTIIALVCVFGTILAPRPAAAVDFPTRPVHVIVPFTAGGAPDVLMRLLGQKLAEKWGQGVVIENRAGGNTLIGTVAGAKAHRTAIRSPSPPTRPSCSIRCCTVRCPIR